MQYHAFLSYSHHDIDTMRRVRDDLAEAGLSIWTDESLVPGTLSWKNSIEEAIQGSKNLVVLLSPTAKHSDWIEKEIDYARVCGVTIVPVLLHGDEISSVPFELINVQRIDIRQNYDNGIQRLISTLADESPAISNHPPLMQHHAQAHQTDIDELNHLSAYDHVRLLIWLFWNPDELQKYRNRYGDESLSRVTAWLVSDFAWIVFLAPAIGVVLGTVRFQSVEAMPYLTELQAVLGVVFMAGWFMTGWFGWRKEPVYAVGLFVVTTLMITGSFLFVANTSGMILADAGGWTRLPFMVLTGIMLSSAAGIAFHMSPVANASIAGLLVGSLIFNALNGVELELDGGIAGVVMFITALLIGYVVDNSLRTGTRTPFHLLTSGLILGTGTLMIVFYFLGGWIFLLGRA